MILAHRYEKMDVVRGSAGFQQPAIKALYDPANVSEQLVLDLRLDEGKSILRRKDDMKIALEKCLSHLQVNVPERHALNRVGSNPTCKVEIIRSL